MSDEINRNQPFDRHTFVDEKKAIEAAFSKGTWFVVGEDGESIVEEPMPESIKATGKIPEGYALDHAMDPSTVIFALATINITTIDQLSHEAFAEMKEIFNGAGNVNIAPIYVVEEKRKATEIALKKMAENPEEIPLDSSRALDTDNTLKTSDDHHADDENPEEIPLDSSRALDTDNTLKTSDDHHADDEDE